MTIEQMHYDFDIKADEVNSLSNKSFTDAEKDWLINEAQVVLLKQRVNLNNFRVKGFEMDQKRIDDLSTLVVRFPNENVLPFTYHEDLNIYELKFADLKYPYFMYLRGRVDVISDNCTIDSRIRLMQTDDIDDVLLDPFNKPSGAEVLANIGWSSSEESSSLYLYPAPGDTITSIKIEYLKYPKRVSLGTYEFIDGIIYPPTNSEMPEHLHPEIVDHAVKMAMSFTQNPSLYQTSMEKIQTQE